ncbi:MAG TPA: hypothetical protein VFV79_00545 [Saprospiraceae bacterium]|nr:hypothetical protein [Saprospiraceae bacterium]
MKRMFNLKMISLIRHARTILVHILHPEGIMLKLFPAVSHGRIVLANGLSATKSPLEEAIHCYEPDTFDNVLTTFSQAAFNVLMLERRKQILATMPDYATKARQILRYL